MLCGTADTYDQTLHHFTAALLNRYTQPPDAQLRQPQFACTPFLNSKGVGAIMEHETVKTWFLAQVKPNCAQVADKNLRLQQFQTFLPMEKITLQRHRRFATTTRPLFPGYVFVGFDVAKGHWRRINSTHGVTRLVGFGNVPAAVPTDIVRGLMERCDSDGLLLPPKVLKPGDSVMLKTGPFALFVAEVERVDRDQRVWLLMEMMGAKTRMAVQAKQLHAI